MSFTILNPNFKNWAQITRFITIEIAILSNKSNEVSSIKMILVSARKGKMQIEGKANLGLCGVIISWTFLIFIIFTLSGNFFFLLLLLIIVIIALWLLKVITFLDWCNQLIECFVWSKLREDAWFKQIYDFSEGRVDKRFVKKIMDNTWSFWCQSLFIVLTKRVM